MSVDDELRGWTWPMPMPKPDNAAFSSMTLGALAVLHMVQRTADVQLS